MAEIIHEHEREQPSGDGGISFFWGVLLVIVILFLLVYFGLPFLRGATSNTPVQVPGKIDVNINQPQR